MYIATCKKETNYSKINGIVIKVESDYPGWLYSVYIIHYINIISVFICLFSSELFHNILRPQQYLLEDIYFTIVSSVQHSTAIKYI